MRTNFLFAAIFLAISASPALAAPFSEHASEWNDNQPAPATQSHSKLSNKQTVGLAVGVGAAGAAAGAGIVGAVALGQSAKAAAAHATEMKNTKVEASNELNWAMQSAKWKGEVDQAVAVQATTAKASAQHAVEMQNLRDAMTVHEPSDEKIFPFTGEAGESFADVSSWFEQKGPAASSAFRSWSLAKSNEVPGLMFSDRNSRTLTREGAIMIRNALRKNILRV